jgi:hypothetical protein
VEVREVPVLLVEVEAKPHEQLVGDGEPDIAHGQVLDEPAVGTVKEGDGRQRRRVAERERLAEVVEREAGVDDVLDDDDVTAGELGVEIFQEPNAGMPARVCAGGVACELEEVDPMRDPDRA